MLGEQSAKTLRGARMEDVIFAGTRDRKPTGMAEVSLTLIDPEAYGGADANAPTEIDIHDDLPQESLAESDISDDWDEASIRARAAAATEKAVEDAQPGKTEEVEVPRSKVNTIAIAFPEDEPIFALPRIPSRRLQSEPQSERSLRMSFSKSAAASSISNNFAQGKSW